MYEPIKGIDPTDFKLRTTSTPRTDDPGIEGMFFSDKPRYEQVWRDNVVSDKLHVDLYQARLTKLVKEKLKENKKTGGKIMSLFKKLLNAKQARQEKYGVFDFGGGLDYNQEQVQESIFEIIQEKLDAKLEAREIEENKKKGE